MVFLFMRIIGENVILIISALLSLIMLLLFRRVQKNSPPGKPGSFKSALNLPFREFKAQVRGRFNAPKVFLFVLVILFAAVSFVFLLYHFGLAAAIIFCVPCAVCISFLFSEIIWLLAYGVRTLIAIENRRMNTIFSIVIVILIMVFVHISLFAGMKSTETFLLAVYNLVFCYLATLATLLLLLREAGSGQRSLTFRNLWKSTFLIIVLFLVILSALSYAGVLYDTGAFNAAWPLTYFDLFYYTCVTFATVGFGDIVPANMYTRAVCVLTIATSIICITILLGTVLSVRAGDQKKD